VTAPFEIHGFCNERFRPLEKAFRTNFEEGLEVGSSLGVTWRGELVVDLWGGWANAKKTRRWRKNTIVPVMSVTKIMLLLCVLRLIDQGRLRLDEPICRYWPAFGQGGKDKVTVRDFITHQGGVPGFAPPIDVRDLPDWKKMTAHIAAQPHRFDGKKVLCYHPVTYGFVLGELVRRIDGRLPSRYFREVFAQRVGADFHMGLSSMLQILRVAETIPPVNPPELTGIAKEIIDSTPIYSPEGQAAVRTWRFASATMPANVGFGNGRSIARLCAIFAMRGRLGWRRYLSKKMVEEAGREQIYDEDLYIGRIRWGLGFGLDSPDWPAPSPTSFHWGGVGGSWGVMDPKSQVSLGFAPNNHFAGAGAAQDQRLGRINAALREIIPSLATR
jgi:CubicO group peptidase (beta-lactamase class C family)